MRWRQHQDDARGQTWRLLSWFVCLVLALVVMANALLALVYRALIPWTTDWPALFFQANTAVVLLFVLGGCWMESMRLREGGGARVARWMGGVPVQDTGDALWRRLLHVVDEMALASGQPPVKVYVLPKERAINAFVAGWSAEDACLCVTQGALDHLSRAELQGLVAHEYGHLAEGDGRLSLRLLALVWGLSLVHGWGRSLMAPADDGQARPLGWLVGLALALVGWLGWLAGRLLQAAVSRQREFLADARAIQFTRAKDGLGQVLRKALHEQYTLSAHWHHPQADALCFMWLTSAGTAPWLASHPPLSERIERIYGGPRAALPTTLLGEGPLESEEVAKRPAAGPLTSAMPPQDRARPPTAKRAEPAPTLLLAPDTAEALGRLARLAGPLQRRMALLALLMEPGNEAERQWWLQEAGDLHDAESLLETVLNLPLAWRAPEFERQLRVLAEEPIELRRTMARSARQLLQADGRVSARDRLWWLLLRHRMDTGPKAGGQFMRPVTGQGRELSQLNPAEREAAVQMTAYLARLIPVDGVRSRLSAEGLSWYRSVIARCGPPGGEARDYQSPDTDAFMQALAGVREMSWVLRPQLMRAWVEEALNHSPGGVLSMNSADALRLAAGLLDTPLPPALSSHYPAVEPR